MTDVDRLTVVGAVSLMLLVARLPEQDASGWGFGRAVSNLFMTSFMVILLVAQVFGALGWGA